MASQTKKFRISSALKDIIGRELITNDFIAVFELVKNSFDAGAKRVDIIFEGLDTDNPKLIIKDNGKGLDRVDLEEKWLFVAYSAKKEGTEDYRDKIQTKRIHAGAKGIGRFSCDRLGLRLTIYSAKSKKPTTFHKLDVNWEDFEKDMHKEFIRVNVKYTTTRSNPYNNSQGVVLEIGGLREEWGREKLLKLRRSLEKLINPGQGNDAKNFSIYLNVPTERAADRKISSEEHWNVVNGKIENRIFEDLGLKTTKIYAEISRDGKKITTRLEDRGHLIYEIEEQNPFSIGGEKLHDIVVHLFALNRSSKQIFTKRMGIRVVEYGSVFLYKNGFRVHPIGDMRGGDTFGLDRRKQQHFSSYLGTRDLIGRVEIFGDNPELKETTSRDGGLIKNEHYEKLQEFFYDFALKRLEKYSIDVIKYGSDKLNEVFNYKDINRSAVFELIKSLTRSDQISAFRYDPKILDILGEVSEQSLHSILKNFSRLAEETGDSQLQSEAKKAERRINQLQKTKEEAERQVEVKEVELKAAEEKATQEAERARHAEQKAAQSTELVEQKTSQNLFLKSIVSQDVSNIVSLHHHIGIAAGTIENYIKATSRRIKTGKPITVEEFLEVLHKISLQTKKISSTVRFSTKANFKLDSTKITENLVGFIKEYLLNVCAGLIKTSDGKKNIEFKWKSGGPEIFETQFRPMEITIILDNLISNSRKAKASKVEISVEQKEEEVLLMHFKDDGAGVSEKNLKQIFELGYTATNGSGLGLSQVVSIISEMKGSIELEKGIGRGAGFKIEFRRG